MNSLEPDYFRGLIKSVLLPANLYSANAEELLLATCAQESAFGQYRKQVHGPALGIFQMEPEAHDDIWKNYLPYHLALTDYAKTLSRTCDAIELVDNDPYAIFMAFMEYHRHSAPLPAPTDLNGLWHAYKHYYNTPQGAATQEEFVKHYNHFVPEGLAK